MAGAGDRVGKLAGLPAAGVGLGEPPTYITGGAAASPAVGAAVLVGLSPSNGEGSGGSERAASQPISMWQL
jgi:hypothetical protein